MALDDTLKLRLDAEMKSRLLKIKEHESRSSLADVVRLLLKEALAARTV